MPRHAPPPSNPALPPLDALAVEHLAGPALLLDAQLHVLWGSPGVDALVGEPVPVG